jgi:hypothetical protein
MVTRKIPRISAVGKLVVTALILCFGCVGHVHAGFKNDYAQWQKMDEYARSVYVMALFDALKYGGFAGEDAFVSAVRTGTTDCAVGLHLTPGMVQAAMTRHYETFTRDWVFAQVTKDICLDYVNTARQKLDLAPWLRSNGSIAAQIKGEGN